MQTTTPVLRRSALEAFSCPYRFRKIYDEGVEDTSDPARRGQAFHRFMELYVKRLAAMGLESDADLAFTCLHEALVTEGTPAHLVEEVSRIALIFAERFQLELDAYLLAEDKQSAAGFTWRPDLVLARNAGAFTELEIKDWKTYWVGLTETQARQEFQGRFYTWQAAKIWPNFDRYRFTYVFVRLGWEVSAVWTPGEVDAFEQEVAAIAGAIKRARDTDHFPAIPGTHCGFCRLHCPVVEDVVSKGLDTIRLESLEDAAAIAGELLALDQAHAIRREALAAYCATEGPVIINGMEWAHRERLSKKYPAPEVLEILQRAGIKPAFDVSASALRSYLTTKKHQAVREPIEALATVKRQNAFGPKKVGGIDERPLFED